MKLLKKTVSVLLAVVMTLGIFNIGLSVSAAQTCAENFNKAFTLTGSGAQDMANVALAQYGKIGSEFGYTEDWCSDFVCDCAVLSGQADVIPASSDPQDLKDRVLKKGGRIVRGTAKPGDLCFVDLYGGKNINSVELVYAVYDTGIYTICGNSGSGSSIASRYVNKHTPVSSDSVVCIVRPNYNGSKVVDLAFVIDTTSSMTAGINIIKKNMSDYIKSLDELGYDYRIAIVDYRDFASRSKDFLDYPYSVVSHFLTDSVFLDLKMKSLTTGNGGDDNETVYSGIIDGTSELKWRSEAGKMIILIGDAAPHDPEPITGYTFDTVSTYLNGKFKDGELDAEAETDINKSITLFSVATGSASEEAFKKLSNASDGVSYVAKTTADIDTSIRAIIESIPETVVVPSEKEVLPPVDEEEAQKQADNDETYGLVITMVMSFMRLMLKLIVGNGGSDNLIGGNEDAFYKIIDKITKMIFDKAVE